MSLLISSVYTYDADASAYILAVEAADGQTLEPATRSAINKFVVGCKADGIWTAIKASCILSGARTLAGALVPLVGTAPTNNNFVSGDYNRKTGLVGNGTTKYLNSNRSGSADPQDNMHISALVSAVGTTNQILGQTASFNAAGVTNISSTFFVRNRSQTADSIGLTFGGLVGVSRSSGSGYTVRASQSNATVTRTAQAPASGNFIVFGRTLGNLTDARLAFYSIGESLDLALLDTRVTDLINAFAVTIP